MKLVAYFESDDVLILENQEDCLAWESSKENIEAASIWLMGDCDKEEGLPKEVIELLLNADFEVEGPASTMRLAWPSSNAPMAVRNLKAVQSLSNWILKDTSESF